MPEWLPATAIAVVVIAALGAIGRLLIWIGSTDSSVKALKKNIEEIKTSVLGIQEDIKGIFKQMPAVSTTGSPLQLTDLGKDISEMLGAKEWARKIAMKLKPETKGKQPYEIQELCFTYVKKRFDPTKEQQQKISECAYEKGLPEKMVLEVLAIELRDQLLNSVSQISN